MVQFGIHGDPQVSAIWKDAQIPDDPSRESNTRGRLAFARTASANSRATTLFVSLTDNSYLDPTGFVPIADAVEGHREDPRLWTGWGLLALRRNEGAVVNVASVSAVHPTRGEAPYSAAKAAVVALTASAALEWAPEVRVNCVSPGFIRTPLNDLLATNEEWLQGIRERTPAGRLGTPRDVAETVAFLLSDASAYVTGQNLVIDGGSVLTNAQMDPLFTELLG